MAFSILKRMNDPNMVKDGFLSQSNKFLVFTAYETSFRALSRRFSHVADPIMGDL